MSFNEGVNEQWSDPCSAYRSAPFWSWNGRLDPARLARTIESLHEAGMGGFFMHSRYGLKTPYLSEEWFKCVSACVEKARQLRMKAYLYDEDRWPSGAAGGLVTRPHPEFRCHALVAGFSPESPAGAERAGMFAVELDPSGKLKSYNLLDDSATAAPDGMKLVSFDVRADGPSGWYNDGAYLDTMNADAVAEFIQVTHQAYADRYGKDFGDVIPAIFTDEPNYGHAAFDARTGTYRLPWTGDLPREFHSRRGYDIRERLPELIFPPAGGAFCKTRYDFYRTCTELFVENFSGQIGKWCGQHRLAFTGHMLSEENLESQINVVGAAMPHYEHMQWPGIDILRDSADELATAKQCTSVVDQLGKQRSLSELYGCTGWDWPMEGHKFIGDWHLATGINLRCPHLTHYSLQGGGKRDYPASIFSHSPWWPHYRAVEDYFARLTVMLTQGKPVRDVLVIHPVESAWGLFDPARRHQPGLLSEIQNGLNHVIRTLSANLYDWDFGDESLLARYGKVSGGKLKVQKMSYELVIVPPAVTLRKTTAALLGRFVEAGGKVLFVGRTPDHLDAGQSEEIAGLVGKSTIAVKVEDFLAEVERLLPRRVAVSENGRQVTFLWSMLRSVKGGHLLFLQSHDRKAGHRVRIAAALKRPVVLWDPVRGRKTRVKAQEDEERTTLELDLPATGSVLLSFGVPVPDAQPAPASPTVVETRTLDGPFDVQLTEPNTLPLDYCRCRVGDASWSDPVPTLKADEMIRKHFGLTKRHNGGHQPWYLYHTGVIDTAPRGWCRLSFAFHVTKAPARCLLAIERPEDFKITVNGKPAAPPQGYWVDEDIRTIDIASVVQAGDNEVLLDFNYRPDMELEDLYLVGDFGVRSRDGKPPAPGNMTLVEPVGRLKTGSWVGQGLDFYGGSVRYKLTVEKPASGGVRISLPGAAATMVVIHAGGRQFVLPWAPLAADITDALKDGPNEVFVEVIGGRKNILGPMHVPWLPWTGPGEFEPDNPKWQLDYQLADHGLTGPVVVEMLK